jgi:hypothetical protein
MNEPYLRRAVRLVGVVGVLGGLGLILVFPVGKATAGSSPEFNQLIVIIVGLFRIDRTTVCGRTGKSLQ